MNSPTVVATNSPDSAPVQSLIWPDIELCAEQDLYFRLGEGAMLSDRGAEVIFRLGARATFDTYYNLFNIGKWVQNCSLQSLELSLEGEGAFQLHVFLERPCGSQDCVVSNEISLPAQLSLTGELKALGGFSDLGILYFELRSIGDEGRLKQAYWQTADHPVRNPRLMLSITTFKREAAVARTVERFKHFIANTELQDHIYLTVVDNGSSVNISSSDHVTVLPNKNLGGSGGFARGLLEAQHHGFSHCLFMDDDAAVSMAAVERTWTFLSYAKDPSTAVAGAMSHAQERWRLWENGAIFDHICRPLHCGLDLRDRESVFLMEFDSTAKNPYNFYGGWWYFAFPVNQVTHLPFPYFLRGDDVSFSLVHDFNTVTLPGAISYQAEDFLVKESPLTVYLDLRSHLTHHLTIERMEIGRKGIVKIMLRFWLRSLIACHYDTLEAVDLAQQDVLNGPEFFRENADLANRRKQIGNLTVAERWKTEPGLLETCKREERGVLSAHSLWSRTLSKITLNGHLFPGFRLIGNQIILPASLRGARRPIWGASTITYVSEDGNRHYTVRHDKIRALRISARILLKCCRMWRCYHDVQAEWKSGYRDMTTRSYWLDRLNVTAPAPNKKSGIP